MALQTRMMKDIIEHLKKENKSLKDDIVSKDKLIELYIDENKSLKEKIRKWEKALIKCCLKWHYDLIIIEWEEVFNMGNYKVVEKKKPENKSLFMEEDTIQEINEIREDYDKLSKDETTYEELDL